MSGLSRLGSVGTMGNVSNVIATNTCSVLDYDITT